MPNASLRPCLEQPCSALVPSGRCRAHAREQSLANAPAWVTRFYNSTAWKKLRAYKRAADPLCEDCLARGDMTPMRDVDHVVPLMTRPDLALVTENLRSLCKRCHAAKRRGAPRGLGEVQGGHDDIGGKPILYGTNPQHMGR